MISCMHFITSTALCFLQAGVHMQLALYCKVQYSLAEVFQKMHHVCTLQLRETLESTHKHVGLVSIAHHHASYWSGSVVAAAYWLLQTRPASGKHSALQQLFRHSQMHSHSYKQRLFSIHSVPRQSLFTSCHLHFRVLIVTVSFVAQRNIRLISTLYETAVLSEHEKGKRDPLQSMSLYFLLHCTSAPSFLLGNLTLHKAAVQPSAPIVYRSQIQCPSSV